MFNRVRDFVILWSALAVLTGLLGQTSSTEILGLVSDSSGAIVPGRRNVDFSLFKNFRITEIFGIQFRAELFNAFNTPYFGEPNNLSFVSQDSIIPDGPRVGEIHYLRTDMRIIQFGLKLAF